MERTYSILIVEDDRDMRSLLRDGLWGEGYQLSEVCDGSEALRMVVRCVPDLILTEVRVSTGGVDYISRLRAIARSCPIVVMTAFSDEWFWEAVLRAGATSVVMKPVHLTELRLCLRTFVSSAHQPIQ